MMAILHTLLNINNSSVLGPVLSGFKDFFLNLTSDLRGEMVANEDIFFEINNSYEMNHVVIESAESQKEEVPSIFRFCNIG